MIFLITMTSIVVGLCILVLANCYVNSYFNTISLKDFMKGSAQDWKLNLTTIGFWSLSITLAFNLELRLIFNSNDPFLSYFLDFVMLFFAHDVYVYASHRLLHQKYLFRKIHSLHHRVRTQTPLSAWSVHPLEALLDSCGMLILPLILSVRSEAYAFYVIFIFQMNMMGHFTLNDKVAPKLKLAIYRFGNFVHHDIHHIKPKKNFGALSLWDRILSTRTSTYR